MIERIVSAVAVTGYIVCIAVATWALISVARLNRREHKK